MVIYATKSSIAAKLNELLQNYIDIDPADIQPNHTLADLGIDSFRFIEIVFAIEECFEIRIDLEEVHVNTYDDVVNFISDATLVDSAGLTKTR